MSLIECIRQASADGEITTAERERMEESYFAFLDDMGDEAAAGRAVYDDIAANRARLRRNRALQEAKIDEWHREAADFRNRTQEPDLVEYAREKIDNDRIDPRVSMATAEGRNRAIMAMAHRRMDAFFKEFAPTVATKTRNRPLFENVLREVFEPGSSSDPQVAALARSWAATAEWLRRRFNAAGGMIPRHRRWGMPQQHSARKIYKAGREAWKRYTLSRLDAGAMVHPHTNRVLTAHELDQALDHVFATITSRGDSNIIPGLAPRGGSFAAKHTDPRFLVFKDFDAWREYQMRFGDEDLFGAMASHISQMSREIAAMEIFGPNPDGAMNYFHGWIRREAARALEGRPDALFPRTGRVLNAFQELKGGGFQRYAEIGVHRLKNMWAQYKSHLLPVDNIMADVVDITRDVFIMSRLGGTSVLAGMTDPMYGVTTRAMFGLPWWRTYFDYLRGLPDTAVNRRRALEAGVVIDQYAHMFAPIARYIGDVGARRSTAVNADRFLTYTGLKAVTQLGKNANGMMLAQELAKLRRFGWADLRPAHRRLLTSMGIQEPAWDVIRSAPTVTIGGVEQISAFQVRRLNVEIGEQLIDGVNRINELAVPTANNRATSLLYQTDRAPKGTAGGVVFRSFGFLKSFSFSVMNTHFYRIYEHFRCGEDFAAGQYLFVMLAGMTGAGMVAQNLLDWGQGRDMREWDDPTLLEDGFIRGGGGGLAADIFRAGTDQYGDNAYEYVLGPVITTWIDLAQLAGGNIRRAADPEQDTRWRRDALDAANKLFPGQNLPLIGTVIDRVGFDTFQSWIDEEAAEDRAERQMNYFENNKNQGFWWDQGEALPNFMRE